MKSRSRHNINFKWVTPLLNNSVLEQSLLPLTCIPNRKKPVNPDHRLSASSAFKLSVRTTATPHLVSLHALHHVGSCLGRTGYPDPLLSGSFPDSPLQDLRGWSSSVTGIPPAKRSCDHPNTSEICNHRSRPCLTLFPPVSSVCTETILVSLVHLLHSVHTSLEAQLKPHFLGWALSTELTTACCATLLTIFTEAYMILLRELFSGFFFEYRLSHSLCTFWSVWLMASL